MATTRELIIQAEKELNAAKGDIAAGPITDRLIDVCECLLEVVGRLESRD